MIETQSKDRNMFPDLSSMMFSREIPAFELVHIAVRCSQQLEKSSNKIYAKVIKSRYLCCSALRTSGIQRTATQGTGLRCAHPARQAAPVKDVPAVGTWRQGDVIGCSEVHQANGAVGGVGPEIFGNPNGPSWLDTSRYVPRKCCSVWS